MSVRLPIPPSSLIGREEQLLALGQQLLEPEVRLLTLTGPPGIGKTRLAIELAHRRHAAGAEAVFMVDLSVHTQADQVLPAVAQALDLEPPHHPSVLAGLRLHLADEPVLLLMDGFEHLLAGATQMAELLASCPRLKILATSRAALHLRSEHRYPVPPLGLPNLRRLPPIQELLRYSAVALFVKRVQAVQPDFALGPDNVGLVAEICVGLEGLPLALELAAGQVNVLGLRGLYERLGHRLDWLKGGARDLPPRQQTLRQALRWSYDLLEERERQVLSRLSVLEGEFSLEAAEAVAGADGLLDCLAALVDKSLLESRMGPDGRLGLRMPETIREYGQEKLAESGEADSVRQAHARLHLSPTAEAGQRGGRREPPVRDSGPAVQWPAPGGEAAFGARLSLREEEVAALLARGLSNRDIARELVITERTAANHVQHILEKLGFHSRSQVVSWVLRQPGAPPC